MKKVTTKLYSYASTLRRINSFIVDKQTKKMLLFIIPAGILIDQVWILDNYLMGQIVNKLSGQSSVFTLYPIALVTIFLVGAYILTSTLRYISSTYSLSYKRYITNKAETLFWKTISKLELQDRDDPEIQNAISDAQRNYSAVNEVFGTQMAIAESIITFCAAIAVLSSLEWWYSIIILVMVIPNIYINRSRRIKNYKQQKRRNEINRYKGELSSQIGTKETILHGASEYFLDLFQSLRYHLLSVNIRFDKKMNRVQFFGNIFRYVLMGILYAAIFTKMEAKLIPVGSVFLLFGSIKRVEENLGSILNQFITLEQKVRETNDFFRIIDMEPSILIHEFPIAIDTEVAPSIEFDNVWFKYPGTEEYVLKGLTFKIASGERIGLIGENGSGKTTVSLLILRFYDPNKGSVLINGVDVRRIDRTVLHSISGAVFQDFSLFQTRISETIRVSAVNKPFNMNEIHSATQKVDMEKFIQNLPGSYSHKIGKIYDGGTRLSGGQRQKIAIAGLLYRDPKLIILDELTSALSPTAEQQIIDQYEKVVDGKTCLVICHRYKSLQFVNRIFVLENGILAENGTHSELMNQKGLYANLYTSAQLKIV